MGGFVYGQKVFLADGAGAYYVAKAKTGHVVSLSVYEGWASDEGPELGETALVVPKVWAKPPIAEKAAEVRELQQEIARLEKAAKTLRDAIQHDQAVALEKRAAMMQWDGLTTLQDFLAGRITHIVTGTDFGGLEIKELGEALKPQGARSYDRDLRLVSLFGDSKGDLNWRINSYRDGSGSWRNFTPCHSHEAALEVARQRFDTACADARAAEDGKLSYLCTSVLRDGQKLGFAIPADIAPTLRSHRIADIRDRAKSYRATVAAFDAEIAAIEAEAVDA